MNIEVTRLLLDGQYICSVRYPVLFEVLQDEISREEINDWLSKINMRLARLGLEGAFFMAPAIVSPADHARFKEDLLAFRDVYGPTVQILEFIRQTDVLNITLVPGETIALYELEQAVAGDSNLEMQFKRRLSIIHNGNERNSIRENLSRMMAQLERDGYVILVSKETNTYRFTGKLDQLYAVLEFLPETLINPNDDQVEEGEMSGDLVSDAQQSMESDL